MGDTVLFSIDHHRGSAEMQAGPYPRPKHLSTRRAGRMDSLPRWRRAVADAGIESRVIGVIGESSVVMRGIGERP